jgi:hypothetical protein
MPENPTQLWRKIIEGVADKFLIAATVGAGGIVLTWLTARSGYFSGQPFYQVALYIVFCLCTVGLYYSWLWIERMQVYHWKVDWWRPPEHLFPDAEPHQYASIGVTLYLRADQARMISEALQMGNGQPLNLDQLQLTVVGARAGDKIVPQTIDLTEAWVSFN